MTPDYMNVIIHANQVSAREKSSNVNGKYQVSKLRIEYMYHKRSFRIATAMVWNQLPDYADYATI